MVCLLKGGDCCVPSPGTKGTKRKMSGADGHDELLLTVAAPRGALEPQPEALRSQQKSQLRSTFVAKPENLTNHARTERTQGGCPDVQLQSSR